MRFVAWSIGGENSTEEFITVDLDPNPGSFVTSP
jgi:hypothetical protein